MQEDTLVTGNEAPSAEDTVNTQADQANLQDQQAPNASQSTEEISSDLTAEDTASDKLYAGKYKSPEELERGYQELQSKYTSTSQEKAQLNQLLTSAFEPQPTTQTQSYDAGLSEEFDQPDPREAEFNKLKTQTAIATFMMTHDDVDTDALDKVLKSDPLAKNISDPATKLEYAYLRSQNMSKPQAIAEAQVQAVRQTQAKVVEKQAAQVEQVQRSQQPDPKVERAQRIAQGDEAARAEAINELPMVQQMKRMAGLSE